MQGDERDRVRIRRTGKNRGSILVGEKRLLDIITEGDTAVGVYKEKKGETVTFSARQLHTAIGRLMADGSAED